jgi:hypothetical protein
MAGAVIAPLLSRLGPPVAAALRGGSRDPARAGPGRIRGRGQTIVPDDPATRNLIGLAAGDGRRLLSLLEGAIALLPAAQESLDARSVLAAAQSRTTTYDRSGAVSAMIKSVRGGDEEAALYWLAVQLAAGTTVGMPHAGWSSRRARRSAPRTLPRSDGDRLPRRRRRVGLPEAHYPLAATVSYLARTEVATGGPGRRSGVRSKLAEAGPDPVPASATRGDLPASAQDGPRSRRSIGPRVGPPASSGSGRRQRGGSQRGAAGRRSAPPPGRGAPPGPKVSSTPSGGLGPGSCRVSAGGTRRRGDEEAEQQRDLSS